MIDDDMLVELVDASIAKVILPIHLGISIQDGGTVVVVRDDDGGEAFHLFNNTDDMKEFVARVVKEWEEIPEARAEAEAALKDSS